MQDQFKAQNQTWQEPNHHPAKRKDAKLKRRQTRRVLRNKLKKEVSDA